MAIGQDLINAPALDIQRTKAAQKRADKAREQAQSVLNLADVLSQNKTAAEEALRQINDNQAAWAQQLTPQMLKQFARRVQELQKDYRKNKISGGITPDAIIARSRRVDIERAQDEIHTVQAVRFEANGAVVFRTNASAKYGATHHMVTVQFLNFQAALNAGSLNAAMLDSYMKSAVKFDCDCGRHRYWYRYVATVGGFAYGKPETAFPKIRNPELTGLACKHVIRVMHTLARRPAPLRNAIKQHIQRFRANPNQSAKTLTKKQAEKAKVTAVRGQEIRRRVAKMEAAIEAERKAMKNNRVLLTALQYALQNGAITQQEYNQQIRKLK